MAVYLINRPCHSNTSLAKCKLTLSFLECLEDFEEWPKNREEACNKD